MNSKGKISQSRSKKVKAMDSTRKDDETPSNAAGRGGDRGKIKKTVIIINNPDELRSKVEKAVH